MALFGTSKLAMNTSCRNSVGSGGMFRLSKETEIQPDAIGLYLGYVAPTRVTGNALVADLIALIPTSILLVFIRGGFSQVLPSIISGILGFMVNLIGRPSPRHNYESQPMCQIFFATDGERAIPNSPPADATSHRSGLNAARAIYLPPHITSKRFVGQYGENEFWGQFHGVNIC